MSSRDKTDDGKSCFQFTVALAHLIISTGYACAGTTLVSFNSYTKSG